MSLNGDVTVIRNGRSTSTVSIYNYPEHLNPFYEDDQHKRLRFWHINKKGDEGRRNSFSLGGFKEMWAFKSFRTKKKSSTLGINKTSESPPTLRRVYPVDSSNLFNSYDRRARYSSNDGDNFQRNAPYRTSLQNVHSTQDSPSGLGLNRNDQYRSTIQFGNRTQTTKQTLPVPQPRRYVYGGSVTPQPSRNSEFGRGNTRESLAHGSSQTSISTNPFDSDYDEEGDHIESAGGATPLAGKRTPRKKRRAPAPPIPIHSTNGTSSLSRLSPESSQASRPQQPELRIEEDMDIANLTAEIESFVKTKSNETTEPEREIKITVPKEVPPNKDLPKTNGTIPKTKPILKTSPNMVITKEFKPKPKNTELQITEELKLEEKPALPEKKRIRTTPAAAARQGSQQVGNVECIHVHVESPRSTPERDATNRVSSFKKESSASEKITAKTSFTLASPPTNRREVSVDVVKKQIQVTETVPTVKNESITNDAAKANHMENGVVVSEEIRQTTTAPTVAKPPIAAKPTVETKSKANNFAVIHKPGRRIVLGNETEEIAVPSPKIVETTEIVSKEHHPHEGSSEAKAKPETIIINTSEFKTSPKSNGIVPTISHENLDENESNKSKVQTQNNNQKHVVFQTQDTYVDVVSIPESRTSVETKAETGSRQVTEKVIVTLKTEQSSSDGKLKEIEPHVTSTLDEEVGAQSLPLTTTTTLEIVERQDSSLQIEEPTTSRDSTMPSSSGSTVTPKPRTTLLSESREEFEALYRNRPNSHAEWKQSTLAPLETHVPPEKRRSVKDIIESINRSQRLLHAAAHKDLPELITTRGLPPPSYSEVVDESSFRAEQRSNAADNDFSQTLRIPDETQRELESILPGTSVSQNEAAGSSHLSNHTINEKDTQKLNNEEIFKKCRVNKEVYDYRETSPTASNLDWNPVPKPKRSKNLTEQREH